MMQSTFKPGEPIQIEFRDELGQITEKPAVVKNILKGLQHEKLYLEFNEAAQATPINPGSEIRINLYNNEGQKCRFGTYIIEQIIENVQPLMLAKPLAVDYTSLRRYFRVNIALPFSYYLNDQKFDGQVVNLSGCGLYAISEINVALKIPMTLNFEFTLPESSKPIGLSGRIVRLEMVGNPVKHGIAIDFLDVDKYTQVEIVVCCAKVQTDSNSK